MQWAKFVDNAGTIEEVLAMPDNYIHDTLGTLPPWGNGYRHPDLWQGEGWRNDVPDNWTPPIPLEKIKQNKWNEIKAIRDKKERDPLPYLGKLFDFDSLASDRLQWAIDAARSAVALGGQFETDWTCYDNSVITLSANDIIGIPLAVAQRSNELHVKARQYRQDIDNAETVEEVEAVIWQDT